jgi:hypothetical protein
VGRKRRRRGEGGYILPPFRFDRKGVSSVEQVEWATTTTSGPVPTTYQKKRKEKRRRTSKYNSLKTKNSTN